MRLAACLAIAVWVLPGSVFGQPVPRYCNDAIPIQCGDVTEGDSDDGANDIEDYSCIGWAHLGREMFYSLSLSQATFLSIP
jgi:hypothetical protein